jgi:hypothetical protein
MSITVKCYQLQNDGSLVEIPCDTLGTSAGAAMSTKEYYNMILDE